MTTDTAIDVMPDGPPARTCRSERCSDRRWPSPATTARGWSAPTVVSSDELVLHPGAHALHYGSACFEGLKAHRHPDGRVVAFRADRHTERLRQSAERLHLPVPPTDLVETLLDSAIDANEAVAPVPPGSLYLRPTLLGTDVTIGSAAAPSLTAILYVLACPVGDYLPPRPLTIVVETETPRTTPQFGVVKAGANYAMALSPIMEAREQWDADQVLFAPGGRLEETGASNVLLLDGHHVMTPELTDAYLHGVTRDSLLQLARQRGWQVEERHVTVDECLEWIARPDCRAGAVRHGGGRGHGRDADRRRCLPHRGHTWRGAEHRGTSACAHRHPDRTRLLRLVRPDLSFTIASQRILLKDRTGSLLVRPGRGSLLVRLDGRRGVALGLDVEQVRARRRRRPAAAPAPARRACARSRPGTTAPGRTPRSRDRATVVSSAPAADRAWWARNHTLPSDAVVADDEDDPQPVPGGRLHLDAVHLHAPVAGEHDDGLVRAGGRRTDGGAERPAHRAERGGREVLARPVAVPVVDGERPMGAAVDDGDRVPRQRTAGFGDQPGRVDRHLVARRVVEVEVAGELLDRSPARPAARRRRRPAVSVAAVVLGEPAHERGRVAVHEARSCGGHRHRHGAGVDGERAAARARGGPSSASTGAG